MLTEHILTLNAVEEDITACLDSAGKALQELSLDNSNLIEEAKRQARDFLMLVQAIETKLAGEINHLTSISTNQCHQGSNYASQKVLNMAWQRLEFVGWRVDQLEVLKLIHMRGSDVPSSGMP